MEIVLAVATVLGGISAVWYFWDKWCDRRAHAHKASTAPGKASVLVYAQARAYGVLMGDNVAAARKALERSGAIVSRALEARGGQVHRSGSCAMRATFPSAANAIGGVLAARDALQQANSELPVQERVRYRFGVDACRRGAVSADAEARAAALSTRAKTDGVLISEEVRVLLPEGGASLGLSAAEAGSYALLPPAGLPGAAGPAQLEGLDLPRPERPSIVLLPFSTVGEDPETQAFAAGLRLDIQNALVKMSGLFLIAAGAANAHTGVPPEQAAARLGVRHVLEGSVQRMGDQVRVSVQLVDTQKHVVAWSEQYDRKLDAGFGLQDEITERVVSTLDAKLASGEQARVWRKCLSHPKARDHFYRGMQAFFQMNAESIEAARAQFERAAGFAPDSPLGASMVAFCLWIQATRGWTSDPEDARRLAGEWAERAAAMDDADGQAHTVLGNVRLLQRRHDEALHIAGQAAEMRPNCTNANSFFANVLLYCGSPEAAAERVRKAIRISPVYPPLFLEILAAAYRDSGHCDLAALAARELLRLIPGSLQGRVLLASALSRGGELEDARGVAREILDAQPAFSAMSYVAKLPYRDEGSRQALLADLAKAGLPA